MNKEFQPLTEIPYSPLVLPLSRHLPKDLYGGWSFVRPFTPEPLAINQVWRKCGPVDALKIMAVRFEGDSRDLQGISVNATSINKNTVTWALSFFITGDETRIHRFFKTLAYSLAYPYPRIADLPIEEQSRFLQFLQNRNKTLPFVPETTHRDFYQPNDYEVWKREERYQGQDKRYQPLSTIKPVLPPAAQAQL